MMLHRHFEAEKAKTAKAKGKSAEVKTEEAPKRKTTKKAD